MRIFTANSTAIGQASILEDAKYFKRYDIELYAKISHLVYSQQWHCLQTNAISKVFPSGVENILIYRYLSISSTSEMETNQRITIYDNDFELNITHMLSS